MCRICWKVPVSQVEFFNSCPKTRVYTASHLQPMWMRTSVLATLRTKKNLKYPIARHSAKAAEATSNSFHQQKRVSYVSDDAVLELPFPWSLCYLVPTLPCRSLDDNYITQPNFFPESPVCKMFQTSWSFLTCSWQLEDVIGPFLTAGYLSELSTMTRASLAHFLQACMNFSWTCSILDEASFKIL